MPDEDEIIETARIVRRFTKSEASVTNRRSGNQDERGLHKPYKYSGGNGERDPPVPIPNTEVKPFSADGTWLETARESRSLPDPKKKTPNESWVFSFCPPTANQLSRTDYTKYILYLAGELASAACGGSRAAGERPGAITASITTAC